MKTLLTVVLTSLLASACAMQNGVERTKGERLLSRYEPYIGAPVKSFTAFRQDSWQPISRTQLVLWTSINDAYLLTISNNCPDLKFANSVRVTSTGSSISTHDRVIVRGNSCWIQTIQPIDVRQMRRDREQRAAKAD
jgi:Family of unknown function (DUF6491)